MSCCCPGHFLPGGPDWPPMPCSPRSPLSPVVPNGPCNPFSPGGPVSLEIIHKTSEVTQSRYPSGDTHD